MNNEVFDAVVVGGGPAGATAALDLARLGHSVLLLDKAGRIKPCGGAIPPRLIRDFDIPEHLLVAKVSGARIVSPSDRRIDMPIEDGFVGMVDRDVFDEWLRQRAVLGGAVRRTGTFQRLARQSDGTSLISYRPPDGSEASTVRARAVIGADGARSEVGRQCIPGADTIPYVFAYHEIVRAPRGQNADFRASRCDVYYRGSLSPDFYGWVFPHGDTISVGTGTARKGFSLRSAVSELRQCAGLERVETIRREGAPIPMRALRRWDDGHNVVLAGDAAGVVAPASGEGIYYAMACGRLAAEAVDRFLRTADAVELRGARRRFMKQHSRVFWVLGIMQRFWYRTDSRRERFVTMCGDADVQRLTWQAYMNKELVRARPAAHIRIFIKDLAHLFGVVAPR